MITKEVRQAVLALDKCGRSRRRIARELRISRPTVARILAEGSADPPRLERTRALDDPELQGSVPRLIKTCGGNLVRVQEILLEQHDVDLKYSTLTRECRRLGLSRSSKNPLKYHLSFEPGEESQHDTSPHGVVLGTRRVRAHLFQVVLCYSRHRYARYYPSPNRFFAKVFLTRAFRFFGGVTRRVVIDNTNLAVLAGTGDNARFVPEMEDFAARLGFVWKAIEKGHSDRNGRVEAAHAYVERNFLAGRTFSDWRDLNKQLELWCLTKAFDRRLSHLGYTTPRELFAAEEPHLTPLPKFIPQPFRLHERRVDSFGYVCLHGNEYSAPASYVRRKLTIKETEDAVTLLEGAREIASHPRLADGKRERSILEGHHPRPRRHRRRDRPIPEQAHLARLHPSVGTFAGQLEKALGRGGPAAIRRLYDLALRVPLETLVSVVERAHHFGLYDAVRVEAMVLEALDETLFPAPSASSDSYKDRSAYRRARYTPARLARRRAPSTSGATGEESRGPCTPDDEGKSR